MMNYKEDPEFSKELKRLSKKWRTLPEDIDFAKKIIGKLYVPQQGVDLVTARSLMFNSRRATILFDSEFCEIVKMRLDCASPGGKNKLRLVFAFDRTVNSITLVELFAKNDKDREDEKRLKKYRH